MTSKEALENWYNTESPATKAYEYELHYRIIKKDLEKLEKLEKALKIIITRYVDLQCLFCSGYKEYNFHRDKKFHVSQEEFNLIKEVLKNE